MSAAVTSSLAAQTTQSAPADQGATTSPTGPAQRPNLTSRAQTGDDRSAFKPVALGPVQPQAALTQPGPGSGAGQSGAISQADQVATPNLTAAAQESTPPPIARPVAFSSTSKSSAPAGGQPRADAVQPQSGPAPGQSAAVAQGPQSDQDAQSDPGAPTDPTAAAQASTPSQLAQISDVLSASAPAQPTSSGKATTQPANISAAARGGSAKPASVKTQAGIATSNQVGAPSSGSDQDAAAIASTVSGVDLKGGGEVNGASVQTDASAAQSAAASNDSSALAGTLQAQAAPSAPSAAPAADARTVTQLSAQIVQTLNGAKSSFDLTLHPEGLGDVQVKVSVDRNGAVTAAMSFSNPQAAAELGARAGDLRDALAQAGFTVADNGLSFNMSGQDQSGAGQGGWSQGANPNAGRAFLAAQDNSDDLLAAVSQAAANLQRPSAAGLDIRI